MKRSTYLTEEILYGGQRWTRGAVIADLQRQGVSQKNIDAYMMGLMLTTALARRTRKDPP